MMAELNNKEEHPNNLKMTTETHSDPKFPQNTQETVPQNPSKVMILDTSNFIRLKPLCLNEYKYLTSEFIVREIKDEKAREFYELNKNFIEVRNPSRETMKLITNFAKLSNDLKNLSIPDLSVLSLSYDLIKEAGQEELIRKEPMKFEVVEIEERNYQKKLQNESEQIEEKEEEVQDGFQEVKIKKKVNKTKQIEKKPKVEEAKFEDEGEWITPENIDTKLGHYKLEEDLQEENVTINVFISTGDFTVQNLAMKMGMPVLGVDGMKIKKIKNYILKCYACESFIFDTSKLFCEGCGYNTLMKIACTIDISGKLKVYNKKAEARTRGTQVKL